MDLIFGGSGFIGKHLANNLESNYLNLNIIKTDKNYQCCDAKHPIDVKSEKTIDIIYSDSSFVGKYLIKMIAPNQINLDLT
jgi:nucleoside-diphosphate-sugar epimerase